MLNVPPLQAWYYTEEQRWLDVIQETLLIVLSVSRLLISREHLSIEKSGIVLIVTLINAADLLSISHSLQYHDVIFERFWMYIGLIILTIGLFQMAFIDTDGLAPMASYHPRSVLGQLHILRDQNLCPLFRVKLSLPKHRPSIFFLHSLCSCTMVCCSFIGRYWRLKFVAVNRRSSFSCSKIF